MNVRNTLKAIRDLLRLLRPQFTIVLSENFLVITYEKYDLHLKISSMGYIGSIGTKLATPSIEIAHKELEEVFIILLSEKLNEKNKSNKTMLVPVEKFAIEKKWIELFSVDSIQPEVDRLVSILDKVTSEIIPHFQDKKAFGNHIAQYSFKDSSKVQVGAKPPTLQAKKIFLLYEAGHIERAEEYIAGMSSNIKMSIEKHPDKKEKYLEWQASLEEFYIKLRNHFNQT